MRVAALEEFCVPFEALSMLIFAYCTGFIFYLYDNDIFFGRDKKEKLFLPNAYKKLS